MYRTDDPAADAARVVARQIRAAKSEDEFVSRRFNELHAALTGNDPGRTLVPAGRGWNPWNTTSALPLTLDFAHWLLEQHDPVGHVVSLVTGPCARAELMQRYALAKAEDEAKGRDWHAASVDDIAWERAGGM